MGDGQEALRCARCSTVIPIQKGIPRFVNSDGYAASFSFEWNRFRTTQLDSISGLAESEERFKQNLDMPIESLRGKLVLDAGVGCGRFAEVALRAGAQVVGIDLSYAVDAAACNLKGWDGITLFQADLLQLPFKEESFDFIYSLGVLHHAPDPKGGFLKLIRLLKPGGKISITLYAGYNKVYVRSTEWWRRLTTRLPVRVVMGISSLAVPLYYLYRIPGLGLVGEAIFPISMHPKATWRVLDTLDCYTPRYQSYHTHPEVFRWFEEAGLINIKVLEPGVSFIAARPIV
jgi:SAM-dependent methyltransferase